MSYSPVNAFSRSNNGLMTILRRRPNAFVYLALASVFAAGFYSYTYHRYDFGTRDLYPTGKGDFDSTWNVTRDARNLKLTDAQCDVAFPNLFKEIDRAVKRRRSKHVTIQEIDAVPFEGGYLRAMIYDQELYMLAAGDGVNSRHLATLHALHRAILTSPSPLPNIEFTMGVGDIAPEHDTWSYARLHTNEKNWLMPDFGYWSWPEPKIGSYGEVQRKAIALDESVPFKDKIPELVWRGAIMSLPIREKLLNLTEGKSWSAVRPLVWQKDADGETHDSLTMDEHCRYKFVAHTEGVSYSSRLQNLQNCRSVLVAHKMWWVQHHTHLMKSSGPEQNFVFAGEDFKDLGKTMEKLLATKDEELEKIAENNIKLFRERYLTPAAETCYWRKLFRGWASVSPEPEFYMEKDGKKVWRGLPVESYLLERRMDWALH